MAETHVLYIDIFRWGSCTSNHLLGIVAYSETTVFSIPFCIKSYKFECVLRLELHCMGCRLHSANSFWQALQVVGQLLRHSRFEHVRSKQRSKQINFKVIQAESHPNHMRRNNFKRRNNMYTSIRTTTNPTVRHYWTRNSTSRQLIGSQHVTNQINYCILLVGSH